jgi:hypothetical protein
VDRGGSRRLDSAVRNDLQLALVAQPARPRLDGLETAIAAIRNHFGEDATQRWRLVDHSHIVCDRMACGNTAYAEDNHARVAAGVPSRGATDRRSGKTR